MQEFKKILIAFFKGQLDATGVERVLAEHIARDPDLAGPYIEQLNMLYKNRRLPPQVYSRFRSGVVAARDAQSARPPTTGEPTAGAPEENSDKTAFRMPPGVPPPVAGSGQHHEATQFRPPTHGATPPTGGQTGAATGHASTGAPGTGGFATGTGRTSSWGSPSNWSQQDGGMVSVGSVIKGRFVLEEMIGKGGMGTVYKARDLRKEEAQDRFPYVALKVLNEEFKQHPDSLKALQREARKAQELAHPNIVNVHDFDRDGGTVFMTMELLQGTPLDVYIREHRKTGTDWLEALPIIKGMSLALDYAHRKRIVHSDFKPGNCFLTQDGVVKVFDFGIARAAKFTDDVAGEETKFDAATLGALTPAYASVEMLEGEDPDNRDDVYALACTAYELLSGAHPFNKVSAAEARKRKLVPKAIKGLPKWRYRALQKGLAFERENRCESAFAFLEQINPKRNMRLFAIGGGAVAVVALVVVALIAVPNYLYQKQIEGIRGALQSNDYALMITALEDVKAVEDRDRRDIISQLRPSITATFESKVASFFDIDNQRYQYPEARAILDRLTEIYPDSALVSQLNEGLDAAKSEILAELARKYEAFLAGGGLLPVEDEDIEDVRQVLAQVDPDDSLLSDPRLPLALAVQAKTAADNKNYDLAESYLAAGFVLAPADASLINLHDRVVGERNAIERAEEISDLEAVLAGVLPSLQTLDDFASVRGDLRTLMDLQPNNAVVGRVTNALRAQLDDEIERSVAERAWPAARDRIADFSDVLDDVYIGQSTDLVADAERQQNDRVAALVANLDDLLLDADPGVLSAARVEQLLQQLDASGAPVNTLVDARTRVASAYLNAATNARAVEDWELARVWVDRGIAMQSTGDVGQNLRAELSRIDNQEQLAEIEHVAQARQILTAQFDARLSQGQFAAQDMRAALRVLDELTNRFAEDQAAQQFVEQGPARLAERVSRAALALGDRERWEDSVKLLDSATQDLGGLTALVQAREQLHLRQQATEGAQLAARVGQHKQALRILLDSLALDERWRDGVAAELVALEGLAPADPFINQTRERAANAYLAEARRLRGDERWVKAQENLDQAISFAPNLASVQTEKSILDASVAQSNSQIRAQQAVAEIEARKQTFSREIDARSLDRAERAFAELKAQLPAGDPFVTGDGPQSLADAYLRAAEDLAARNQYTNAIRAADKGLSFVAQHPGLVAGKAAFVNQRDAYIAVTTGNASAIAALAGVLDNLKPQVVGYSAFERRLRGVVTRRIEDQARSDPALADTLFKAAQIPFPGLTVRTARPAVVTPAPPQIAEQPPPVEPATQATARPASVSTPPASGDPCRAKRPGGKRTCRDLLPGDRKGPYMVVVPDSAGGTPFAITRYEVSIGDYNNYCRASGECTERPGQAKNPLTNVSVAEMKSYAAWLGRVTPASYALPTKTEWEYAARADGSRLSRKVNCYRRDAGGQQAGGFSMLRVDSNKDNANSWGLVNTLGNAAELVTSGGGFATMGGSYKNRLKDCAVNTVSQADGGGGQEIGFRLVRRM